MNESGRRGGRRRLGAVGRLGWLFAAALLLAPAAARAVDPTFSDQTVAAGVDYDHSVAIPGGMNVMTGGVAVGDVDRDGLDDIFVTRIDDHDLLFINQGGGVFSDGTVAAGLDAYDLPSNGAAFGDVDNDGDLDLYVTLMAGARHYLFINDGTGVFSEEAVARGAGMSGTPELKYGQGVTFGDVDKDGYLDIYVCEWRHDADVAFAASNSRLLRNLGAANPGHFEDITAASGVAVDAVPNSGPGGTYTFSPAIVDMDDDGWPDLVLANDFHSSRIFWNDGNWVNGVGTFTDGTAAAMVGSECCGMGSTIGDYNGDGLMDWMVTAIYDNPPGRNGNRLFLNLGGRVFADDTDGSGGDGVRDGAFGWGVAFFDYDNDADLDLIQTNGFPANPWINDVMRLFRRSAPGGVYDEVAAAAGITDTGRGKGLAVLDYDDDGDLDAFIANNGQHPVLYRNDGGNQNGWLRVKAWNLSESEAIGARVELTAVQGGPTQTRIIGADAHYLGNSERVAHFGLGPAPGTVSKVRVEYLSGSVEIIRGVNPNTVLELWEADASPPAKSCGLFGLEALPLIGWAAWRRRRRA